MQAFFDWLRLRAPAVEGPLCVNPFAGMASGQNVYSKFGRVIGPDRMSRITVL